eukprot:Sdes_comp18196_c0_seq3m7733
MGSRRDCEFPLVYMFSIRSPFAFQQALKLGLTSAVKVRCFHKASVMCAGQKFRVARGLARSNTEYGPLVDTPDWRFADGRQEVHLSVGKQTRYRCHTAIAGRIEELLSDLELIESLPVEKVEELDRQKHAVDKKFVLEALAAPKMKKQRFMGKYRDKKPKLSKEKGISVLSTNPKI